MGYDLEEHFRNPQYSHLDHYTKLIYIEYIKELSKLCRNKEWDGFFPEYLISRLTIEKNIENWKWDKKIAFAARDAFMDGVNPDFYLYIK
jgi:hypothetical protein